MTSWALIWLSVVVAVLGTVAVMPARVELLSVSTKVIAEDALKCVDPLPVMVAFTVIPTVPAPGETTATAAGGFVVLADPIRDTTSGVPPGAEFPRVSEPVSGPFAVRLGAKFVVMMHDAWASTTPEEQLLLDMKSPARVSENGSCWLS
jgi:hypothetical protein